MTSQSTKRSAVIEGMVAGILNERELAINVGANQGVEVGMKFKVLAAESAEIRDPQTNEVLGSVDQEKVRVRVIDVQDKFSIGRTYKSANTVGSVLAGLDTLSDLLTPSRQVPQTLRAEAADYLPPLSEQESYVKKGDRVIQLEEDDHS